MSIVPVLSKVFDMLIKSQISDCNYTVDDCYAANLSCLNKSKTQILELSYKSGIYVDDVSFVVCFFSLILNGISLYNIYRSIFFIEKIYIYGLCKKSVNCCLLCSYSK